ncbi:MAG: type II secretion system minor pseudopilin GspI [Gammaproteobacteria bacterium]|nr:type II secretion system minor pseudopilin GspI [Gammaproteobacteria bacterium]
MCRAQLHGLQDQRPCRGARLAVEGFTLLEVLVALGVLALTMGAVIKAVGDYTGNQSYLRDRTLAVWAARNVLAEQQLENAWPGTGEFKGTTDMGKREWRWLVRVTQTEEAELRRLDVEVQPIDSDAEQPLAVLSGFLWQPAAGGGN